MKHSILYYSDCRFFAGCENMIANFLNDQTIQNDFSVSFAYSYSEEYEHGLNSRVSNINCQKNPLRLMTQLVYQKPPNSSFIGSITHKVLYSFYIPLHKYSSILINSFLLLRFFKKHNATILHINNGGYPAANSCYSAVIAGKMAGINKIVYVVNNLADDYKHPFRWLDFPIDFLIKKWVTVFITGSDNAGERLKKVLNLGKDKHLTINNGIQKSEISIPKKEFKKKYSIPENKLIVTVGANLEKRKGHIFLLEAVLQIKREYPQSLNLFFIFAGNGQEKSDLEKYITENKLGESVLIIGHIPDIFNLINASDFVILPSIANEDFPFIIIEAMSFGKPVIGTEIAGIPEQIENNKTGIIVKPRNSEELKLAIMRLTTDPLLMEKFSIEAKKRFDTLFEMSISIKKYNNLYKSLL